METTGILAKKFGMSRIIADDGKVIPVTMLVTSDNVIDQIKTQEKDGYSAMVVGFEELKNPRKTRKYYFLKELPLPEGEIKKGDKIGVKDIPEGAKVTLIGVSKGKGFAGSIKRHNFGGGRETHGGHQHRTTGSIGQRAKPGEVHKGKRMPGRMGTDQITLRHREIIRIIPDKNVILVKGPVPGATNSLVIVKVEK